MRFEFGSSTRIVFGSTLASAGIGLLLALCQVQGWTMPKFVALVLIAVLVLVIAVGVATIVVEAVRWVRRFLEHRATSASWVASDAPGLADYEADGIRAQKRFTHELNKMNKRTVSLGKKLQRHAKRMQRLQGKSAKRRQRAANRSAKSMNRSAIYIEKRLELLRALVKDIERNYRGLTILAVIESDADFEAVSGLRDTLDQGRTTTAQTLVSVAEYRSSVEETEALNLARTVRNASGRLAKALRGIEATFKAHEKGSAGLVRDMDKKLDAWARCRDESA
jgi:hypothetical protein